MTPAPRRPGAGFAAFRHRDFAVFWPAALAAQVALQMLSVAVGWQVYEITRDPLDLGLIGLAEFLPAPVLLLATGHAADRFERRGIVRAGYLVQGLAALVLCYLAARGPAQAWPFFAVAVLLGTARAFAAPAARAMLPDLVPMADLPNAVAWRSTAGFHHGS